MTMKVTGRKASLYATAMAISLVALSGTAHAQSASNGLFKPVEGAKEAPVVVKKATTVKKATLTDAEIAKLATATAQKKIDLSVRNVVTAEALKALAPATATQFTAAQKAVDTSKADATAQFLAALRLDATDLTAGGGSVATTLVSQGAPLTTNVASTTAVTTHVTADGTKKYLSVGTGAAAQYFTDDTRLVGKIAATSGTTEIKWQVAAKAVKDAADTLTGSSSAATLLRAATASELQAANTALGVANTNLAAANLAATTASPNTVAILAAEKAVVEATQRVAAATTKAASAESSFQALVTDAATKNTTYNSALSTASAAQLKAAQAAVDAQTANTQLNAALALDTGFQSALSAVKVGIVAELEAKALDGITVGAVPTDAVRDYVNTMRGGAATAAVTGTALTQAQVDAVKAGVAAAAAAGTSATDVISAAQIALFAKYGQNIVAATPGTTLWTAQESDKLANVYETRTATAVRNLSATNLTTLAAIAAFDDAEADVVRETSTTLSSNGFTRSTGVLADAAASSSSSISMASKALTADAAALDVNASFEIEVLDTLVDHEERIVVLEDTLSEGIAVNTAAIATESAERKAADVVLTTAIATEATERKAADAALDTRVTAVDTRVSTVAAGLTAETAARIAADTANNNARIAEDTRLAGLITAETNARVAMGQELRDRIASSTATAIALGGTALLPDMGFTLSGNVAFYEGAQAIALNAAAKVGPNAYVTAAAGGGLNKKGSVGGRVGFVIGF